MTIVQNACNTVEGFTPFYQKFLRRMIITDRAQSTCSSYGRSLAVIALHFNSLPVILNLNQVEDGREKKEGGRLEIWCFWLVTVSAYFKPGALNFYSFSRS